MPSYLFDSTAALVAALQLCDDAASWRGRARRTQLRRPDGGDSWLIETPEPIAGLPTTDGLTSQRGKLVLADGTALEPTAQHEAASLVQAVPLVPAPRRQCGACVVETYTETAFVDCARSNLMLGCDRIRFAAIGDGRHLLSIEAMSRFLAEKWLEADDRRLFHPSPEDPRVLLPAGWAYPLSGKFRFQPTGDGERWLLEADGPWRHVRAAFRDVYEVVALDSAALAAEDLQPAGGPPRVVIGIRLEPDETPLRPVLWRLPTEARPALEAFLREAGESELGGLEIAVVEDATGRSWYVLSERRRTGAGIPPEIRGAEPFCARLAEEHLHLPVGLRLAPVLSRRTLVEALGLTTDHLTLVEPGPDDRLLVTRLPRTALQPLPSIVEYLAGEAAETVRDLMAGVRMDFAFSAEEPAEAVAEIVAGGGWLGWWRRLRR